jgi:hypothetical protein
MCKHEGRSVIRGIAPPPLPSVVGPGAAYGSKNVSPDDPRADVVEAARDEVIEALRLRAGCRGFALGRRRSRPGTSQNCEREASTLNLPISSNWFRVSAGSAPTLSATRDNVQITPKAAGVSMRKKPLDFLMSPLPNGNRARQQSHSLGRQSDQPAAPIRRIDGNRHESTPFQWLQRGSERGAVHRKQRCYVCHCRRRRPVQGHQQGDPSS